MQSILYEAIILERIGFEFVIHQNTVAGTEIHDDFDVLNWFQIQKMKFPILTHFNYIIHSITSLKTENERDFSLAGIYTVLRRKNISVEMLFDLLLINRNSAALGHNSTIDLFRGSLDALDDIVDEMKSNPYDFSNASDTE